MVLFSGMARSFLPVLSPEKGSLLILGSLCLLGSLTLFGSLTETGSLTFSGSLHGLWLARLSWGAQGIWARSAFRVLSG